MQGGDQGARQLELARRKLVLGEELAGVGSWTLDVASGRVAWSRQVYRIHGLDPAAFDPQLDDALAFYEDETRTRLADHLARVIETGEGFSCKGRLLRPLDGEVRVVLSRGERMSDEDTGELTVFGVVQDVTEEELLLQQLSEERERFRLLTQNATDVIATYLPDATFTYLSPAITALAGRTPAELVGRKTYEIIHPDDHKRVGREFRDLVESRRASARIEYRVVRPDGGSVWVEAHPSPIYDAQGRFAGCQDVVRDVSARKAAETAARDATERAEQALASARESEARYRLLAENANDMIAITSPVDSEIRFVSPGSRRVLGYEPEELVGRRTLSLTHPDDRPYVFRFFTDLIAAGPSDRVTPYRFRGLHKDGSWVWLEGQPRVQFDETGAPVHFQDVVRDIEARKLAEDAAALAAERAEEARSVAALSERRYRLLAENATDMISRFSLSGRLKYVSPACERMLGYTPEEMVARKTIEFMHPDDIGPLTEKITAFIGDGPGAPGIETRFRAIRKDGGVIWLEGRPTIVFSDAGEALEMYDVVRDVTARKRLEDELDAARIAAEAAAQAKSDFLANMSHELRTPLTAVIGFADLTGEQPELSAQSRLYVDRVRTAGRALLATVNDVLDFSKLEAGHVEISLRPTDPADLTQQVLDLFSAQAAGKGLALRLSLAPRAPGLYGLDPDRVRQVLTNLVGNAVKFTNRGGVTVRLSHARDRVRVEVCDTGEGIPADRLGLLFQRFSQVDGSNTRRHGGTGLGLAICKGLVEAMGGAIGVTSRVGTGSTFHFELPAAAVQAVVSTPEDVRPLMGLTGRHRLLLAEDNAVNRELVKALLASYPLGITAVEDGEQAVAAAAAAPFDLILMDLHMPGIGGYEAATLIRSAAGPNAATPIVAFSADVLQPEMDVFDGMVSKPISPRDLLQTLDAHLSKLQPASGERLRQPNEAAAGAAR